ncbi:monovalent cation/H+ antiporter complex subunit F [Kocuria sp.]|uniref:monovalent cation/H+ antiporter complex subunit F n=1 Tax=Kocuria sp. TaxID=1871328 RepID=UPI0034CDC94E
MNSIVLFLAVLMLAGAAAGVLYRLVKGPALLDRVLASDVLLAIVAAAVCVDMLWQQNTDYLVLTVMISLVGFLASVTFARFVQTRPSQHPDAGRTRSEWEDAEAPSRPREPGTGTGEITIIHSPQSAREAATGPGVGPGSQWERPSQTGGSGTETEGR